MPSWSASPFSTFANIQQKQEQQKELKVGRSMYDFGKQVKEKARQQKQMAKASKRIMAKQQKADLKTRTPDTDSDISEPQLEEQNDKGTA